MSMDEKRCVTKPNVDDAISIVGALMAMILSIGGMCFCIYELVRCAVKGWA